MFFVEWTKGWLIQTNESEGDSLDPVPDKLGL